MQELCDRGGLGEPGQTVSTQSSIGVFSALPPPLLLCALPKPFVLQCGPTVQAVNDVVYYILTGFFRCSLYVKLHPCGYVLMMFLGSYLL